jgi:hypothetical protein
MAEAQERHTPPHMRRELQRLDRRITDGDPLWPAQLAVAVVIALHLGLSDKLVVGPKWLVPAVEGVLLITLIVIAPPRANRLAGRHQRPLLWTILALVTLTYLVSLALLVHYLVTGGRTEGRALIGSGAVLWLENIVLFSVVYFELDGGGPLARFKADPWRDFQFPQMEEPELTPMKQKWRPTFIDYLYTSLTNATAFSPTDTMPITQTAKLLMGTQGSAAIVTVGLVLARAVNILG